MTAKEKAQELVLKYLRIDNNTKEWFNTHIAKQCALIAVDEIINSSPARSPINDGSDAMPHFRAVKYWQAVKQEIESL